MSHFRKCLQNRIWIDINKKQLGLNSSLRSHHFPQCQFQQQKDEILLNRNYGVTIQDCPVIKSFSQSAEPWTFITNPTLLYQLPTTNLQHMIPSLKTQYDTAACNNPLESGALWCNPTSTAHRKVNSIQPVCLWVL